MSEPDAIRIVRGLPEAQRGAAAQLFVQAFGEKLRIGIPDRDKQATLVEASLVPELVLAALDGDELVGMAALQTSEASATEGIGHGEFRQILGFGGALRAGLYLSMIAYEPAENELYLEELAVRPDQRGKGVGTALLEELVAYGEEHGFHRLRLQVVDTNQGARRLYAREGFRMVKEERYPFLGGLLGFGGSETMERVLTAGRDRNFRG